MLIFGLSLAMEGVLGERYLYEAIPFLDEELWDLPAWVRVFLGLFMSLVSLRLALLVRHRAPSSLNVE